MSCSGTCTPSARLAEMMRFAIGGGGVAVVAVATYWACAGPLGIVPQQANLIAFVVQAGLNYQVQRVFTFRAGAASRGGMARFAGLSGAAFGLNSLWVWVMTGPAGWPGWTPILPMVTLTPLATFLLARHWVFGRAT